MLGSAARTERRVACEKLCSQAVFVISQPHHNFQFRAALRPYLIVATDMYPVVCTIDLILSHEY